MKGSNLDIGRHFLQDVAARAAKEPKKPIRAFSPDFPGLACSLTIPGWELVLDDEIFPHSLPGHELLHAPDASDASAAFALDCWEIYCSRNAFKVAYLLYLPALLRRKIGGVEVSKRWLKRIYVTVNMFEVKESGWVRRTLEGLMDCERLEEVTIELTSKDEQDSSLMERLLEDEVRPVASQLRERVRDQCVEVRHVKSWRPGGGIEGWQVALGASGDPERARELARVHRDRDLADKRWRASQLQFR